jgi:anti-anti-sigma factor
MFAKNEVTRPLAMIPSRPFVSITGDSTDSPANTVTVSAGSTEHDSLVRAGSEPVGDREAEGVQVIRIPTRRLDGTTCLALKPLFAAAWKRGASTVVLDMGDVVFVDSLGISALVAEQRRRPRGTRIVVSSLNDFVRDVFEVTQLFQLFDVFGTSSAAVSSVAA